MFHSISLFESSSYCCPSSPELNFVLTDQTCFIAVFCWLRLAFPTLHMIIDILTFVLLYESDFLGGHAIFNLILYSCIFLCVSTYALYSCMSAGILSIFLHVDTFESKKRNSAFAWRSIDKKFFIKFLAWFLCKVLWMRSSINLIFRTLKWLLRIV